MTSARELLQELCDRGLELWAAGDRLRYRPRHVLDSDPELRARVLQAKPELLQLLPMQRPAELNQGLAVREVLGFPAALLRELPIPTTLVLALEGEPEPITIATHPGCPAATFGAPEWLALALAAENERADAPQLAVWLARKHKAPGWQLTQAETLGPVFDAASRGWNVGRVLRQLGATLRAVAIEGGA